MEIPWITAISRQKALSSLLSGLPMMMMQIRQSQTQIKIREVQIITIQTIITIPIQTTMEAVVQIRQQIK